MPLTELSLSADPAPLPGGVRALLREADRRIGQFLFRGRIPAFVPRDYEGAYRGLRARPARRTVLRRARNPSPLWKVTSTAPGPA